MLKKGIKRCKIDLNKKGLWPWANLSYFEPLTFVTIFVIKKYELFFGKPFIFFKNIYMKFLLNNFKVNLFCVVFFKQKHSSY